MTDSQLMIKVTHANTKAVAFIFKNKIWGYYYSESHKSTMLFSTEGGLFPVKESVDEIKELLTETIGRKDNVSKQ